jgi:hypothetical protein
MEQALMVAPAVGTRIVTEESDDGFVGEVDERDYELALFMAPAPIEDARA